MNLRRKIALWACIIVCMITVLIPTGAFAASDLYITASEITLKKGATYKMAADYNGTSNLHFASSDTRVALIDDNGSIRAIGKGESLITVRAEDGSEIEYCTVSVDPEVQKVLYPKVHFYQGDAAWRLPYQVRKTGCVLTSMAMLLKNSGIDTNPGDTYRKNGNRSGNNFNKVLKYYNMRGTNALHYDSEYLKYYDLAGAKTHILNPAKNYEKAVQEALKLHPEGVLCYFVKGGASHAIVATSYENGKIYYNDAGRRAAKGEHITFDKTWCAYRHRMDYGDFAYFMAITG